MAERATILAGIDIEAERLAKLPEYERAVQLQPSARRLDIPLTTLERRVALYGESSVVVDAVELGRRLGRLVFLLGSDEPANVLAAVNALGSALRAAGRDWSYLSRLVAEAEPSNAVMEKSGSWVRAGEAILEAPGLDGKERGFVEDMLERFNTYGDEFMPTEKQTKWFVALHRRYVRDGR
jgi:hypothetical protein